MSRRAPAIAGYRHQALFYGGEPEFVGRIGNFLRDGVKRDEPTLVVVSARKIDRLRRKLGRDAAGVQFADMADVGANPARIIPAWRDFVEANAGSGRAIRGVGEPIFPERSVDELAESEGHEALLNAAFDDSVPFWLLCPYDTTLLSPIVLTEAERNHPVLMRGRRETESVTYLGRQAEVAPFTMPLPDAPAEATRVAFEAANLHDLRTLVAREAAVAGFSPSRLADLVFSVNEVATNSVRHGGGKGSLLLWSTGDSLAVEIIDAGLLVGQPLVGRARPRGSTGFGTGLWLVNQLCDLVQLRSFPTGVVVRLRLRRR
ncbi:MAG: sensor histidine kinase [Candidatus Dormibacter sp.]